jgi:hypothetical protein
VISNLEKSISLEGARDDLTAVAAVVHALELAQDHLYEGEMQSALTLLRHFCSDKANELGVKIGEETA